MKKHKLLVTILCALLSNLIFAQSSETVLKYIAAYKEIAILEMQRTGVPAAITLAQGIHETSAGTSHLVLSSNNHFGIKCKSDWKGATVYHDDDAKGECFRKYENPLDSYRDHSDFLKFRSHYASLFKLDPTDYQGWAFGLKKAGYATNPRYPQVLIKLIEDYNLQEYTLMAMNGKTPAADEPILVSNKTNELPKKEEAEVVEEIILHPAYPSGVFKINETSVVFVAKGTAFLKVAEENKLALSRLYEFNDMNAVDIAANDQLIYLQRKRKTGANEFHIVGKGENVYHIAQAEGIRMESLLEYNFLKMSMQPAVGEKIYLHGKAPSAPKLAAAEPKPATVNNFSVFTQPVGTVKQEDEYFVHVVQPKETMYAIARKYAVEIEDLKKWNALQANELRPGQQLKVSKKNKDASN